MNRLNRYALSVLALSAMVAILAGVNATPTQAGPTVSGTVNIGNTPLPITGNTTVSGTVNIGNTPLPVALPDTPLTVKDADNPARQPWQHRFNLPVFTGTVVTCDTADVPAGKMLVIEYVSANEDLLPDAIMTHLDVITTQGGTRVRHFFTPSGTGRELAGTARAFVVSQSTRLYSEAGTASVEVCAQIGTDFQSSSGDAQAGLSGYLVDVP
jgi:hypothetical protein